MIIIINVLMSLLILHRFLVQKQVLDVWDVIGKLDELVIRRNVGFDLRAIKYLTSWMDQLPHKKGFLHFFVTFMKYFVFFRKKRLKKTFSLFFLIIFYFRIFFLKTL